MLKIRLQRVGRRNHAEFRVVVTEHARAAKSSNYIERLGSYNPHSNAVSLDSANILAWIEKGAQPSNTVHNLLVREGVITAPKKNVLPKKTAPAKESAPEKVQQEQAPAKVEAKAAQPADEAQAVAEETTEEK
jgi:small subunit ribosomal protein S16